MLTRLLLRGVRLYRPALWAGGVGALSLFVSYVWVEHRTAARAYTRVADVPHLRLALVLGCAPRVEGGRRNLYFQRRMEAVAELYHAGRVDRVLVSGDSHTRYYNEPLAMRKALVDLGVPSAAITSDFAGLRTLDSVVRAQRVFGAEELLIVSQAFHTRRALYIARHIGLDAWAYDAAAVRGRRALRTELRELLARARVLLDLHVLGATRTG